MSSVIKEIATYLAANGLGTLGTDVFWASVPQGVENGLVVLDLSSSPPDPDIPTKNPNFQIMVRATEFEAGNTKLLAIKALLHQVANTQIGNTFYYYILAQNNGGHTGRDEAGHDLFSINFGSLTR